MITTTTQQEAVDALFLDQGLEMGNEPVDRNIQKIWIDMEDGELVGAATLGLREGHWVVDGIAVLPAYRKSKRGSRLLQKVVDEARNRGASRIWLVAKSRFLRKKGFPTRTLNTLLPSLAVAIVISRHHVTRDGC